VGMKMEMQMNVTIDHVTYRCPQGLAELVNTAEQLRRLLRWVPRLRQK
jgi:hypothetical protein